MSKELDKENEESLDIEQKLKELEEKNKLEMQEMLAKKDEDAKKALEETTTTLMSSFEEKFNKMKEESEKEKETFNKILEGLQNNTDKDDILKEIELNNQKALEAEEKAGLIKLREEAEERARLAEEKAKTRELEAEERLKQMALEKEKSDFKSELINLKSGKPWLADKIDKLLAEDDYKVQKDDYRFLVKYFDTPDEEERYKAKKKAGKSSVDGVNLSKGKDDKFDIRTSTNEYLNKLLGKNKK